MGKFLSSTMAANNFLRRLFPTVSTTGICVSVFACERPSKVTQDAPPVPSKSTVASQLSPLPPHRILRPNPFLEICYDTRTRNAVYVQHRVLVDSDKPGTVRRPRFFEEKSLEPSFRSKDTYFTASGYDRGHLAPAGDFVSNPDYFHDTFNLCNASPQDKGLNRKLWAQLEDWSRKVAQRAAARNQVTYNTTGPIWLPRVQLQDKVFLYNVKGIGTPPGLVMVPSHFFKVVVVVDAEHGRIVEHACFVVPNDAAANDRKVEDYVVAWSDLEMVTGLVLFPGLANETFKKQADQEARALQTQQAPLLLTDGKQKSSRWSPSSKTMHHLCANKACAFPKQSAQDRT